MIVKYRHRLLGGHVHVRVFAGDNPDALGGCGTLVFREDEWKRWKDWVELAEATMIATHADHLIDHVTVQFVEEATRIASSCSFDRYT